MFQIIYKLSHETYKTRVYQNGYMVSGRDIFLYLSVKQSLNINMLRADKYKNMSLQSVVSVFCTYSHSIIRVL